MKNIPKLIADKYQEFFNFMMQEHNLTLTISEMDEIRIEADKLNTTEQLEANQHELIDRLSKIMRSMLVHPECVEGSEFDDQTSAANDLINKLKE